MVNLLDQKRLEFLEKTVSHFNADNRGIDANGCSYSHANNGGCAIGRECTAEVAERIQYSYSSSSVASWGVFEQLPPHLKILGKRFLLDIQLLHDEDRNWVTNGPSVIGHQNITTIKRKLRVGDYYQSGDDDLEKTLTPEQ
jgi:hypothetical protein